MGGMESCLVIFSTVDFKSLRLELTSQLTDRRVATTLFLIASLALNSK